MISDLRIAVRGLMKTPGFAGVSVLILALGIGAITGVFSAVEAVLLRPLPFANPGELYTLHSGAPSEIGLFSIPEFCEYRDATKAFQGLAAGSTFNTNLVNHGEAELVQGLRLSGNTFTLLGVRPALGRLLAPADDAPGAPRVAVIGAGLWKRSFGASPDVVGRTVSINGLPYSVVGVLPEGFVFPVNGFHDDVCVPLQPDADPVRYIQSSLHFLRVVGRIAPGASEGRAMADMGAVLQGLKYRYPKDYEGYGANRLTGMSDQVVGDSRPMLLTLFGLVAALLLLASTNLAGLHLVRAIGRQHDFALRTALGASRLRLLRPVIAECLVLAAVGGACGLLLAAWGLRTLMAFVPADLPRGQGLGLNPAVFAFAAAASILFGLLPALAPVWMVSGTSLSGGMAAGGRRTAGGQRRARHILAATQVALALTLLACTALFLRSFWAAGSERLGFDKANAVSVRLTLPEAGYRDSAALFRHVDRLRARLEAIPGVDAVGTTSLLPLSGGLATIEFTVTGQPPVRESEQPSGNYRLVTPGYFESMKIALREGRTPALTDDRDHPLVVVIGSTLARALFPDKDPVGQHLDLQDLPSGYRTAEIIGVVADVKQAKIEDAPTFDMYVPYRQMPEAAVPWLRYRTFWVLRGSLPPAAMEAALRREVRAEDASIALSSVRTLAEVSDAALSSRRFTLLVVGFFAGTALLLTIAGIYSVVAFGVAQRTREFGVRLALGAKAHQILSLVLREGMAIVALGAALGVLASLGLSRLIAAQLYGVGPRDPAALAAAVLVIAATALVASWLPARGATRVDPMVALRTET
jgi:putative ABC transport system permease protein